MSLITIARPTRQRQKFPGEWCSGALVTFFRLTSARAVPNHHQNTRVGRGNLNPCKLRFEGGARMTHLLPPSFTPPMSLVTLGAPSTPGPPYIHLHHHYLSEGWFFSHSQKVKETTCVMQF